jgi:hypothetical protein
MIVLPRDGDVFLTIAEVMPFVVEIGADALSPMKITTENSER